MSKRQLYTLEFPVRCSPTVLWDFLCTPAGLQEWFADHVSEWEGVFTFSWSGEPTQKAQIVDSEEEYFIRYRWEKFEKDEYLEFRINQTEISHSTVLVISDFAEKEEIKDLTQLWKYQVKELFHRLGA
jgi:uncharacterized protein YndB with AHSA1/START domain